MTYHLITEDGPYSVGDAPASMTVYITDENSEAADLPVGTVVSAELYNPGNFIEPLPLIVTPGTDEEADAFVFSGFPPLDQEGLWYIRTRVTAPQWAIWAAPLPVVAMAFNGWMDLDTARAWWSDAPADDAMLYMILRNARTAIEAWAPKLPADSPAPPAHYTQGQLLQAQAIATLGQTNPQEEVGFEQMSTRVYPLDWNIKQLVRPRSAVPVAT